MKITEKMYIERLEQMLETYPGHIDDCCPMHSKFEIYDDDGDFLKDKSDPDDVDEGLTMKCVICRKIIQEYSGFDKKIKKMCPCFYYTGIAFSKKLQGNEIDEFIFQSATDAISRWKEKNKQENTK